LRAHEVASGWNSRIKELDGFVNVKEMCIQFEGSENHSPDVISASEEKLMRHPLRITRDAITYIESCQINAAIEIPTTPERQPLTAPMSASPSDYTASGGTPGTCSDLTQSPPGTAVMLPGGVLTELSNSPAKVVTVEELEQAGTMAHRIVSAPAFAPSQSLPSSPTVHQPIPDRCCMSQGDRCASSPSSQTRSGSWRLDSTESDSLPSVRRNLHFSLGGASQDDPSPARLGAAAESMQATCALEAGVRARQDQAALRHAGMRQKARFRSTNATAEEDLIRLRASATAPIGKLAGAARDATDQIAAIARRSALVEEERILRRYFQDVEPPLKAASYDSVHRPRVVQD